MSQVSSTKPYLIRAIHEWCADQGLTPYLAVTVDARARVPRSYVKDGQIVLNISHDATSKLELGNEVITFSARFNGVVQNISVPVNNVSAIYARENGQGMGFEPELVDPHGDAQDSASEPDALLGLTSVEEVSETKPAGKRSHLSLVK